MGGIFSSPKKPKPLPPPEPPIAPGSEGQAAEDIRNKNIKAGRGGTILAGPLSPRTQKKRLLGGNV